MGRHLVCAQPIAGRKREPPIRRIVFSRVGWRRTTASRSSEFLRKARPGLASCRRALRAAAFAPSGPAGGRPFLEAPRSAIGQLVPVDVGDRIVAGAELAQKNTFLVLAAVPPMQNPFATSPERVSRRDAGEMQRQLPGSDSRPDPEKDGALRMPRRRSIVGADRLHHPRSTT